MSITNQITYLLRYSYSLPKLLNSTKMKESEETDKINNFQTKSSKKLDFYMLKSKIRLILRQEY